MKNLEQNPKQNEKQYAALHDGRFKRVYHILKNVQTVKKRDVKRS